MDQNEKSLIDNLFSRLRDAEQQSGPRDAQAEAAIREALTRQPAAPYYMSQAILVQEHAMKALNERVRQLEESLASRPAGGGGFLSNLFGGGSQPAAAPRPYAAQPTPFSNAPQGSFLGGAMQTAMGVAGGMLLANALGDLFSGGEEAVTEAVSEPLSSVEDSVFGGGGFFGDESDDESNV